MIDVEPMRESARGNPDLMKGFVSTFLGKLNEKEFEVIDWERFYSIFAARSRRRRQTSPGV